MQLNEIRTELTSTKQTLLTNNIGTQSITSAPLRLLDTPRSSVVSLDLMSQSENGDHKSDNSSLQLNNPTFIKNTLQKCYKILQRDNATSTELEAVENLVQQFESDMAANAQLEHLQKQHIKKNKKQLQTVNKCESDESSDIIRSETNSMIKQFN
eukprot:50854_1